MRRARGFHVALAVAVAVAVAVGIAALAAPAHAHGMRSAYLEIDERSPGSALVRLRSPLRGAQAAAAAIGGCAMSDAGAPAARAAPDDSAVVRAWVARCPGGLAGAEITLRGLGEGIDEAVVLVRQLDEGEQTGLLTLDRPSLLIARRPTGLAVAGSYVVAGLRHIAGGADHLLFLLLLVLHLRRVRPILVAETAFSLSHGVAFAATALGWIRVAPAPAEACIALSLVLLALDAGRAGRMNSEAAAAALALVFGLVHGLGFAGGLREVGLPDGHAAWALLGFGLGVELGQVAVVLGAWALLCAAARWQWRATRRFELAVVMTTGALAMSWLIERTLACFSAKGA